MLLPIIELDMTKKNLVYQLPQEAFSGEDNAYTIRLKPIDYDWAEKTATIVWSPVNAESPQLDVTDGVVSMLVNSAWITAGLNRIQLNIYGTDGVLHEQSPIVRWHVRQSLPATDPAPERVDIIADLITQTTAAVDSLDVALDMTTSVETLDPTLPATVNLDKSGNTWELQIGIPQGIQGIQGEPGADGLTVSVNEVEQVNGNISITLDDIPDGAVRSISALAADIDAQGEELSDVEKRLTKVDGIYIDTPFEMGNITYTHTGSSNWTYSDRNSRIRIPQGQEIHLNAGDVIRLTDYSNARFYVAFDADDGTFGWSSEWKTSDYTAPKDGDYSILVCHLTDTELANVKELSNLVQIVRVVESFDVAINQAKTAKFTSVILSNNEGYIAFDTNAMTLTIPADTILITDEITNDTQTRFDHYKVINSETVIDYSGANSSALTFYYDLASNTFGYQNYRASLEGKLLIASARLASDAHAIKSIVTPIPYKIDGKPYGIDVPDITPYVYWAGTNVKSTNHRGYSYVAPENTLSAFKLSRKMGFRYVETDVSFTSDGVAVCLHDNTVDRTSNGTGNINNLTYEQVRALDFGSWKSTVYAGEKIPSFVEFIRICKNLGLHPYIELKSSVAYTAQQIQGLVDVVRRNGMSGKVTWISFNPTFLGCVQDYDETARLGYVVGSVTESVIQTANGLKNDGNEVFIDSSSWTSEEVNLCVAAGIPLEVWTVDNESSIVNLDPYITGVTSNNLIAEKVIYDSAMA